MRCEGLLWHMMIMTLQRKHSKPSSMFTDRYPQAARRLERDTELLKRAIAEPFQTHHHDAAIDPLTKHGLMKDVTTTFGTMAINFGSTRSSQFKPLWCASICHNYQQLSEKRSHARTSSQIQARVLCAELACTRRLRKSSVVLCGRYSCG